MPEVGISRNPVPWNFTVLLHSKSPDLARQFIYRSAGIILQLRQWQTRRPPDW